MEPGLEQREIIVPQTLETRVALLEKKCNEVINKFELDGKLMVVYLKLSQENFPLNLWKNEY